MAVIRRHWKVALVHLLIVIVSAGGLVYYLTSQASIGETAVKVAPGEAKIGPNALAWTRVQQLRNNICLTNGDLAAMGCSKDQASQVLTQLLGWYEQNKSNWDQVESQEISAQHEVDEAFRKINVGPKDPTMTNKLTTLQNALATAHSQRQQLEQSAATSVSGSLGPSQQEIWTIARSNSTAPERLRYASGLSAQQIQSSTFASFKQSQRRGDSTTVKSAEASIITPFQQNSMAAAAANQEQKMADVIVADNEVLPMPEEMKAPQ